MIEVMTVKPRQRKTDKVLLLAHGAGAPMDSYFMARLAQDVAAGGIVVSRFNFPYMQEQVRTGKKRSPDGPKKLLAAFQAALDKIGSVENTVIGGKSLGGRMASLLATETTVSGLVCLGYPFHPPGKPDVLRTAHLKDINVPTLIVHGTRDPFGRREEVSGYDLPRDTRICWMEDGNHDFKPRKASGLSHEDHLQAAAAATAEFVLGL